MVGVCGVVRVVWCGVVGVCGVVCLVWCRKDIGRMVCVVWCVWCGS